MLKQLAADICSAVDSDVDGRLEKGITSGVGRRLFAGTAFVNVFGGPGEHGYGQHICEVA